MKDELHDTAMREYKEYGRDRYLTWKDWVLLFAIGMFNYWLVSTIRG